MMKLLANIRALMEVRDEWYEEKGRKTHEGRRNKNLGKIRQGNLTSRIQTFIVTLVYERSFPRKIERINLYGFNKGAVP